MKWFKDNSSINANGAKMKDDMEIKVIRPLISLRYFINCSQFLKQTLFAFEKNKIYYFQYPWISWYINKIGSYVRYYYN